MNPAMTLEEAKTILGPKRLARIMEELHEERLPHEALVAFNAKSEADRERSRRIREMRYGGPR